MHITDVYKKYTIPPLLQLHQLRAGAVGKLIVDNWKNSEIDKTAIIEALLLHDMGNIIKFDLDNPSKLIDTDLTDLNYWKSVKKTFIEKYGSNEHDATYKIGKELNVSETVENLLSRLKSTADAANGDDYNLKICFYSDLRCGPFGILSVNKRFDDLIERYKGRDHPIADINRTETNRKHTLDIQKQLQEFVKFDLETISDEKISENIRLLKVYNVS
jgi:hypothetical protein